MFKIAIAKVKNLSRAKVFLSGNIFFISGIALASFYPLPNKYNFYIFIFALLILIFVCLFKNRLLKIIIILLFCFLLGFWRLAVSDKIFSINDIAYYNGQKDEIVGIIIAEPDLRSEKQKLRIGVELVANKKAKGNILVTTNNFLSFSYGDKLELICDLQKPDKINDFAYDRYLARYDIYSVCYYPEVKIISRNNGNFFFRQILNLKNKLKNQINLGMNEPVAGLTRAILFNDQSGFTDDLKKVFSTTGLTHIVAISGSHISILSAIFLFVCFGIGLNRKQAFWAAIIFIAFYIILVGAPASAVRSGVMAFFLLLALSLGRMNNSLNSLIFAASFLLFFNPKILRDDVGFQLSFLAVLGMIYWYPILNFYYEKYKLPINKNLYSVINLTIGAQIFTTPIIAYNFSTFSLVSLPANLAVLWVVPIFMSLALAALLLSFFLPAFSIILFLPPSLALNFIIITAELFSKLPYSNLTIGYLSPIFLIIFYLIIFTLTFALKIIINRQEKIVEI